MATTLPAVSPKTHLGSTINKVIKHAAANEVYHSKDLKVSKTGHGTSISVSDSLRNFPTTYLNYRGEYDPDAQYSVDDVVRVLHDTNYSNTDSEDVLDATPGVYVCVKSVPNFQASELRKSVGINYGSFVRVDAVKYHPVYPEPEATAEDVIGSGDPFTVANVRYWELLSLLPRETNACVDGVNTTFYVDMYQSGSITGSV